MKNMFSALCLLMLVAACGSRSDLHGSSTAQQVDVETSTPSAETLKELMNRWNVAANDFLPMAGSDVHPGFESCFHWRNLNYFRIPTFCGGSTTAYRTFEKIVDRFFSSAANVKFIEDNKLWDYPLEVGTVTQSQTILLKQLRPSGK